MDRPDADSRLMLAEADDERFRRDADADPDADADELSSWPPRHSNLSIELPSSKALRDDDYAILHHELIEAAECEDGMEIGEVDDEIDLEEQLDDLLYDGQQAAVVDADAAFEHRQN